MVGVPLLVSYEQHWACSRLRYQVLLNALRLFRPDCALMRRAAVALSGPIPEHVRLSSLLDLRLVDARGASAISRADVSRSAEDFDFMRHLGLVWDSAPSNPAATGEGQERGAAERAGWLSALSALSKRAGGDAGDLVERFFGTSLGCDRQLKIGESRRFLFAGLLTGVQ